MSRKETKGLVRIDSSSTHGWQVRVYRNGKTYSRLFSDRKYGGPDEALEAAKRYRETLAAAVAKLPSPPQPRRLIRHNRSNKTGVTGISRTRKRDRHGNYHEVYAVSWNPEPGVARSTSFAIKRYGEDTAFRLACKLRWEKMRAIYGDRYTVPSYLDLYQQKNVVDARAKARQAERDGARPRPPEADEAGPQPPAPGQSAPGTPPPSGDVA